MTDDEFKRSEQAASAFIGKPVENRAGEQVTPSEFIARAGFVTPPGCEIPGGIGDNSGRLPKVTTPPPPAPTPLRQWEEFGDYRPNEQSSKRVIKETKDEIATQTELAKLSGVEARQAELRARYESFSIGAAEKFYSNQKFVLADSVKSGNEIPVFRELTQCYEDFSRARRAIEEEMRSIYEGEAVPILRRIAERLVKASDKLADRLWDIEEKYHREWDATLGISFIPSGFLVLLRQSQWRVPDLIPSFYVSLSIPKVLASLGTKL